MSRRGGVQIEQRHSTNVFHPDPSHSMNIPISKSERGPIVDRREAKVETEENGGPSYQFVMSFHTQEKVRTGQLKISARCQSHQQECRRRGNPPWINKTPGVEL